MKICVCRIKYQTEFQEERTDNNTHRSEFWWSYWTAKDNEQPYQGAIQKNQVTSKGNARGLELLSVPLLSLSTIPLEKLRSPAADMVSCHAITFLCNIYCNCDWLTGDWLCDCGLCFMQLLQHPAPCLVLAACSITACWITDLPRVSSLTQSFMGAERVSDLPKPYCWEVKKQGLEPRSLNAYGTILSAGR